MAMKRHSLPVVWQSGSSSTTAPYAGVLEKGPRLFFI
jgi:hypothetical protein